MTERYPEFDIFSRLPPGTILDGEMVLLKNGKPDFALLGSREHTRSPFRIATLARSIPATYIVFDLLYQTFTSIMSLPLQERRDRLGRLVQQVHSPRLVLSEGVVGQGKAFFEEAVRQNLEGAVAKRLSSPYLPGKRTDAWIKIKRAASVMCAIIGFVPSGPRDFRSLIIATEVDGQLQCCGKVGSGIDRAMQAKLNELLWPRLQKKPLIPCKIRGKWVTPGLYCKVSYLERLPSGEFRAPVFQELLVE
jgi:ATP-dependent DNA ligase